MISTTAKTLGFVGFSGDANAPPVLFCAVLCECCLARAVDLELLMVFLSYCSEFEWYAMSSSTEVSDVGYVTLHHLKTDLS